MCIRDRFIVFGRRIKGKSRVGHRIAQLVGLADQALRDLDHIEFEGHIGVIIAPLQIEKPQGMVGVIRKGIQMCIRDRVDSVLISIP